MEKDEIEKIKKLVNNGGKLFSFEAEKLLSALEAAKREVEELKMALKYKHDPNCIVGRFLARTEKEGG